MEIMRFWTTGFVANPLIALYGTPFGRQGPEVQILFLRPPYALAGVGASSPRILTIIGAQAARESKYALAARCFLRIVFIFAYCRKVGIIDGGKNNHNDGRR